LAPVRNGKGAWSDQWCVRSAARQAPALPPGARSATCSWSASTPMRRCRQADGPGHGSERAELVARSTGRLRRHLRRPAADALLRARPGVYVKVATIRHLKPPRRAPWRPRSRSCRSYPAIDLS
jgi:hypothetical protein